WGRYGYGVEDGGDDGSEVDAGDDVDAGGTESAAAAEVCAADEDVGEGDDCDQEGAAGEDAEEEGSAEGGEVTGDGFLEVGQGGWRGDGDGFWCGRVDESEHLGLGGLGGRCVGEDDVDHVEGSVPRCGIEQSGVELGERLTGGEGSDDGPVIDGAARGLGDPADRVGQSEFGH